MSEPPRVLIKHSQYSELCSPCSGPSEACTAEVLISQSSALSRMDLVLWRAALRNQVRLTENAYFKYQLINCRKGLFSNGITFES